MRTLITRAAVALLVTATGWPLGAQTTDWYAFGGDSQRDGFEKGELRFTKDEVKNFQFLWQRKLDNPKQREGVLLPPVVVGRLIGYRGFKELAIVAGGSNNLWAMDSDLDRMYWERHIDVAKNGGCQDSLTAVPALPGPIVFKRTPKPATPPATGTVGSNTPARRQSDAFYRFSHPQPIYVLTSDGVIHQLNQNDGSDMGTSLPFIPPGSTAQALNIHEDTVYTSTRSGCGQAAAIWSIDTGENMQGVQAKSNKLGADVAGLGGVVLDRDGNAYVQTLPGELNPDKGTYGGALVALDQDLKVSRFFALPEAEDKKAGASVTPVVFSFHDQEMIAAADQDGRVYLLKASELGGQDHHGFVSKSLVVPALDGKNGHGMWGGLSSWEDTDGSRYVLAPVWGPLSAELQAAVPGTDAPNGSIVAFKVDDSGGAAALKPVWVSRDLDSPTPAVIARGVVFALSNGKFAHAEKKIRPVRGTHATLYALDGTTGKEMYSTGDKVTTAGNLTGIAVANSRVYFVTIDNTLQVFGKYWEH